MIEGPPASRRWLPWAWAIGLCALAAALAQVRSPNDGLLDWDTYGRLHFLYHYEPERWLDGHVLYHYALRALMRLGVSPLTGVYWATAVSAAALVGVVAWICSRERLDAGATGLVLLAATLGSPGLVSLFLMAEDNVPYAPLLVAFFYLQAVEVGAEGRRAEFRRSAVSGLLLAAAMLVNVSLLVLLFAVAAVPLLWRGQRLRAWGLAGTVAVAFAAYHLAHLFPFTGALNAMHAFLPQALAMRDYQAADAGGILSLSRMGQFAGGLRAVALTPSAHLMALPPAFNTFLVGVLPKVLAAVYLALLLAGLARFGARGVYLAGRRRVDLVAFAGICVVFPYLYEPALIERWDVFWAALLVALVLVLKARPSPLVSGLVIAAIAIQSIGSVVAIAHHKGRAFAQPGFVEMRGVAADVARRGADPIVLPYQVDRLQLADLAWRTKGRGLYLVRDTGEDLACFKLFDLQERPVPLAELQASLRSAGPVFVHPSLSRHSLRLLGLAAK